MDRVIISEWIDIEAPREEVFEIITNLERRMQLSPLWGMIKVTEKCGDYPAVGSGYMMNLVEGHSKEYETIVTELVPPSKFAYCLDIDMLTTVSWSIQKTTGGARLAYSEEYQAQGNNPDEFNQSVRKIIREWLANIKRYSELRGTRLKRLTRRALDRYYLKLQPAQRRTMSVALVLQITTAIAFLLAAIGMGIAGLLF